ncbi:hypothetical protein CCY99_03080 [Helicobacter sp. 16-1353]|uniref:DUF2603 domain-containing protein n=1 Tax=Helicobacter sp. 16-1353 TaxID=2004996 RepID=UPI000DCCB1CD|nr:DUF2603 domain-containing protein [Helicobacter sp. 16-1353]RAX54757.1 hypothetical protein CCY99_03080 [Helicobacter sp. 16-1353]
MEKINKAKTQKNNEFILKIKESKLKSPTRIKLDNKKYVIIAENEYLKMQETIKNNNEELIFKNLEREILQEMPKDFDDVFIVAKNIINDIQTKKKNLTIYDIKRIVKDIKSNYPNLFIDIDEYFKEINSEFE